MSEKERESERQCVCTELAHIIALRELISCYVINLSIICGTKCNFANLQRISNYVSTAHSNRGRGRQRYTPLSHTHSDAHKSAHKYKLQQGKGRKEARRGGGWRATTESNINLLGHRDSQRLNKSTCIMKLSACLPPSLSTLPPSLSFCCFRSLLMFYDTSSA